MFEFNRQFVPLSIRAFAANSLCQPHLCGTADDNDNIDEVAHRCLFGGFEDDSDEVAENVFTTAA